MNTNVKTMSEIEVLNAALAVGWVKFSYYKADGSKRIAIGTRNRSLIERITNKGYSERKCENYYENCNGYFDLTRCDWRQFNTNRFIGMEFDHISDIAASKMALILLAVSNEKIDYKEQVHINAGICSLIGYNEYNDFRMEMFESDYRKGGCSEEIEFNRMLNSMNVEIGDWVKVSTPQIKESESREELIKELIKIRQRESEILEKLLK